MRSRSTPSISEEPITRIIRDCVRYGSMAGAEKAVESGVPAPSRFVTRCAQTLEEWRRGDGVSYFTVARAGWFLDGPAVIYELRAEIYGLSPVRAT